jgi:hypothetical protein
MFALQNDSIIYAIAANCGIDWDKCLGRINYNGVPIKHGIHADSAHKGNVMVVAYKWTAPDGKEYRTAYVGASVARTAYVGASVGWGEVRTPIRINLSKFINALSQLQPSIGAFFALILSATDLESFGNFLQ